MNAQMANDPVCGMRVYVGRSTPTSVYAGKTYYFCSKRCKQQFDEQPERHMPTPDEPPLRPHHNSPGQ